MFGKLVPPWKAFLHLWFMHGMHSMHNTSCLFIFLRELHLMKGPDTEGISVVCSSDILEQYNISKLACDILFG